MGGDDGFSRHILLFDDVEGRPHEWKNPQLEDGLESVYGVPEFGIGGADVRQIFFGGAELNEFQTFSADERFEMAVGNDGDAMTAFAKFCADRDEGVGVAVTADGDEEVVHLISMKLRESHMPVGVIPNTHTMSSAFPTL